MASDSRPSTSPPASDLPLSDAERGAGGEVRVAIIGLGNVGRRVLRILHDKRTFFRDRHGLEFLVTGAADSKGAAWTPDGLDLKRLIGLKEMKDTAASCLGAGHRGASGLEMLRNAGADVLVEASPVNLKDGEPGMSHVRQALEQGMHVVTANKAPLALAFPEIMALARERGRRVLFSATVGGGLPAVNIGVRDLCHARVERLEGVVNLTSHFILTHMGRGYTYQEALTLARKAGHAEADLTLDVDGWDAANKLVILANSVLGFPARLTDVRVAGIRGINRTMLAHAREHGNVILPLAVAEKWNDGYRLSVQPTEVDGDHPLASLTGGQMGIVYYTDTNGVVTAIVDEIDPMPTAGAVVRDLINLYRE